MERTKRMRAKKAAAYDIDLDEVQLRCTVEMMEDICRALHLSLHHAARVTRDASQASFV